jgi:hypothetical protein
MTTAFKNYLASGVGTQLTITAVTPSSPTASSVTLTFATQVAAPFTVGEYITVSGVSDAGYNGTYQVTACNVSTVTYTNADTNSTTNTGTITPCMWISNSSANTTVIGFSITNKTSGIIQVNIQLIDTIAGTTAFYINNVTLASNTSFRAVTGGEKLILGPSTAVNAWSNIAGSIDVVASWVEIS